jgi:hypothetical protein
VIVVSNDRVGEGVSLASAETVSITARDWTVRLRQEKEMTLANQATARVALLITPPISSGAWSRRCGETSNRPNGRPVQPRSATSAELKREVSDVGRGVHRAHGDFWCEGHLGEWNGLCGHRVLAGEGYVQSGELRLCLACAAIEAKQVEAGEEAFAREIFAGVKEALAAPGRSAWSFGTPAGPSSTEKEWIEKEVEEPHDTSESIPLAQALLNEKEQLAKLVSSQATITRILEDERRHGERLAGNSDRYALPTNGPVDEEVILLVEGIAEEVAVIGVLCDTLRDRLESVCSNLLRRNGGPGSKIGDMKSR